MPGMNAHDGQLPGGRRVKCRAEWIAATSRKIPRPLNGRLVLAYVPAAHAGDYSGANLARVAMRPRV
jgi:hypothetical protein